MASYPVNVPWQRADDHSTPPDQVIAGNGAPTALTAARAPNLAITAGRALCR